MPADRTVFEQIPVVELKKDDLFYWTTPDAQPYLPFIFSVDGLEGTSTGIHVHVFQNTGSTDSRHQTWIIRDPGTLVWRVPN